MRPVAALLILLAVPAAAAAQETPQPFSLFARSQHYSMNVDVVPHANGDADYNLTITDLATNTVIAQPHIAVNADHTTNMAEMAAGDLTVRALVRHLPVDLSVFVEISKGDTVVDSIGTIWSLKPHPRRSGSTMGMNPTPPRPLPPDTYRVGGDVRAPIVIDRVEPAYPEEARRARVSGIVIVEALIDKTGAVRDVQVLKPLPFGLDQAAVDAVKQWRFQPATKNGEPVNVVFNLTVNFKLSVPKPPEAVPPRQ